MRVKLERRTVHRHLDPHLVEVITPRTNLASLTSAENMLATVSMPEAFALEISADHRARRFLMRTASKGMLQHLAGQLGAAYPQAALRVLDGGGDPARVTADEQVRSCTLELRGPEYLPIRAFTDAEIDPAHTAQADPVLGILGALGDLPPGWRAVSQLVMEPVPDDWCREHVRLAVQHPLVAERVPRASESSMPSVVLLVVLLGLAALGLQTYDWYQRGQWFGLFGLALLPMALVLGVVAVRRLFRPALYDMELVREKISRIAFRCELRLSIIAPSSAELSAVQGRLDRLGAAYRHYNLAAGNGFRVRAVACDPPRLRSPLPMGRRQARSILTTRELAGLWHLPHAEADVALLERTTARRWLPQPGAVGGGCRIGASHHNGRSVPVEIPDDVLRRHLLLVAKTRRGKSTLMLRLAQHALLATSRRAVMLVDPHQDLAEAVLGLVPPTRRADVIYVNLGDLTRPVGLNILDAGLGWQRDTAVNNALTIFQREWGDRFWGPRMEDVFRFALLSLFEANARRCAAEGARGRAAQYTLLDLSTLLRVDQFRKTVLAQVGDPVVHRWWATYFDPMERRFQAEVINPVLTKVHRFEGSTTARMIVGQPASTIDPAAWLREGAVIVVNTARGTLGENASALLGSTLLNLVALSVAEQARVAPDDRPGISMFVDEFHTLPGVDYEGILAELSKYGASLVLATQSLARLEHITGEQRNDLRAMVFANLDGLFAFNCSAEDALYLVPELGGALDVQDLVELGEHQCYARISSGGERLPTFSVSLDPPQATDAALRATLTAASAERYGRPRAEVEAAINVALVRGAQATTIDEQPVKVVRNQHRPRKKRRELEAEASAA
ncbi:MAG TPA: type IV secretion system DNA-binding domain-containing protein [Chloroflexota bacterium]